MSYLGSIDQPYTIKDDQGTTVALVIETGRYRSGWDNYTTFMALTPGPLRIPLGYMTERTSDSYVMFARKGGDDLYLPGKTRWRDYALAMAGIER